MISRADGPTPTPEEIEQFCNAADENDDVAVESLLNTYGFAIVDQRDKQGLTALHYAIKEGHKSIVELLLRREADIEINNGGYTALLAATTWHWPEIIALLLEKGASVDAKSCSDQTALMIATRDGRSDIISMLMKHAEIQKEQDNQTVFDSIVALTEERLDRLKQVPKISLKRTCGLGC